MYIVAKWLPISATVEHLSLIFSMLLFAICAKICCLFLCHHLIARCISKWFVNNLQIHRNKILVGWVQVTGVGEPP